MNRYPRIKGSCMMSIFILIIMPGLLSILFFACSSCAMDPAIVSVWGSDMSVPKLTGVVTGSETVVSACFTSAVTVSRGRVLIPHADGLEIPVNWDGGEARNIILFNLETPLDVGVHAVLDAAVVDGNGNSLSFSVPFTGFNNRLPQLVINEIRTEYSKPKVEYIELFALTAGNLAGVQLENPMNSVRPVYEFPAVEIAAGDYIVYHLRSVEEGLVDELGAIDLSGGIDSRPFARDFWDTLTSAPLKKTNVLILRERSGGAIMDAVHLAETDKLQWPSDGVRLAAEESADAGHWFPGADIAASFCSTGTTATRTIGRDENSGDTGMNSDWKICGTSKCSPGATNSPF